MKTELPLNKIIRGNCLEIMGEWPEESIDMVITSPPYYGLRSYPNTEVKWNDGQTCQLGLESSWQFYIQHLVEIFREVRRVLKKEGSFWLNVGDTYATHTCKRSGQFGNNIKEGFDDVFRNNRPKQEGIPEKCQMMIPHRLALALVDDGWICRNTAIWYKPNSMPSSVRDRLTNKYEFVFHFVKSPRYYYNLNAIRVSHTSMPSQKTIPRTKSMFEVLPFSIRLWDKLFAAISAFDRSTIQTLSFARIRDKIPPTFFTHFGYFDLNGFAKSFNIDLSFKLMMARNTHGNQITQGICGIVTAKIPDWFYMMDMQRNTDPTALFAFVVCPIEGFNSGVLPVPSFFISAAATPIRIFFLDPISRTPLPITLEPAKIDFKNSRLVFGNGDTAPITLESDMAWSSLLISGTLMSSHSNNYERTNINMLSGCAAQPLGKNPGDVLELTKHDQAVGRIGNFSYSDPLHEREYHPLGANPGDFWSITTKGFPEAHFAVFPEALCELPIKASCPPNGIVLDPLAGSGTTCVVAQKLGRKWIGIELNPRYVEIAKRRMSHVDEKLTEFMEANP